MSKGIRLWRYDNTSELYKSTPMITPKIGEQGGNHKRGVMNKEGLYITAGFTSHNVKIYDMKYYNHPDQKIELLRKYTHEGSVYECILKNTTSALCCVEADKEGYIKEYNLANPRSLTNSTPFYTSDEFGPHSMILTMDKKYVIAGSYGKLYILDAEDGSEAKIYTYINNNIYHSVYQMAEVRPYILITVDYDSAYIHNITNITNPTTTSINMELANGLYYSVIALKKNEGDVAIGGRSTNSEHGFVYILNIREDNTINRRNSVENIPDKHCIVTVIKEFKMGTLLIGGDNYCQLCLWNYSLLPIQDPICWDDLQSEDHIYDLVGAPY